MPAKKNLICVYSTIVNHYDDVKEFPKQDIPCDFIMFTDDVSAYSKDSKGWQIEKMPENELVGLSPFYRSRYLKILNHRAFCPPSSNPLSFYLNQKVHGKKVYDWTIWVDASAQIISDHFVATVIEYAQETGLATFHHPDRNSIYEEGDFMINSCFGRFAKLEQKILNQLDYYRKQDYHENNLRACGVIVRNMHKDWSGLNKMWWGELVKWQYRDQLSFPYVLWKKKINCGTIDYNLWNNPLIRWTGHNETGKA
jgi:hypothetical protein